MKIIQTINSELPQHQFTDKSILIAIVPELSELRIEAKCPSLIFTLENVYEGAVNILKFIDHVITKRDINEIVVSCNGGYTSKAVTIALEWILNGAKINTEDKHNLEMCIALLEIEHLGKVFSKRRIKLLMRSFGGYRI